jgi:hypothetical protein
MEVGYQNLGGSFRTRRANIIFWTAFPQNNFAEFEQTSNGIIPDLVLKLAHLSSEDGKQAPEFQLAC